MPVICTTSGMALMMRSSMRSRFSMIALRMRFSLLLIFLPLLSYCGSGDGDLRHSDTETHIVTRHH
jgi:hypothetical protein